MINETMRRVYLDAQKGCGLKVGDKVVVERKADAFEGGWASVWPFKGNFVGSIGKINTISSSGIGVYFADISDWFLFPYFVLRKVNQDDYITGHALCGLKNGDRVKVIRPAKSGERGWGESWSPMKNEMVGKEAVITLDDGVTGFYLHFLEESFIDMHFPYFVLEKVESTPVYQFKPFDRVLVRDGEKYPWKCDFFSHYNKAKPYPYYTISAPYAFCIQYEGNEDLVGTTKEPK